MKSHRPPLRRCATTDRVCRRRCSWPLDTILGRFRQGNPGGGSCARPPAGPSPRGPGERWRGRRRHRAGRFPYLALPPAQRNDPAFPDGLHCHLTACCCLSAESGRDTETTRAFDNRPMSSRSEALFHSITEVEHVLRQHDRQFNQHSRCSSGLVSRPSMVVEHSVWMAVRTGTGVGTRVPVQATSCA